MVSWPQVSANQWIRPEAKSAKSTPSNPTNTQAGFPTISGNVRNPRTASSADATRIEAISKTRIAGENSS